jgi:hypothetical protein
MIMAGGNQEGCHHSQTYGLGAGWLIVYQQGALIPDTMETAEQPDYDRG